MQERAAPVPPPAITAPTVPQIPPLDPNQPSPPLPLLSELNDPPMPIPSLPSPSASPHPDLVLNDSILNTPPIADPFSPFESFPPESRSVSASLAPELTPIPHPLASDWAVHFDDEPEIQMKEEDVSALAELAEAVKIEQGVMDSVDWAILQQELPEHFDDEAHFAELAGEVVDAIEPVYDSEVKMEDSDLLPPPPPPPPPKTSARTDHVDVDLGPLKSVSRNHAKIEYRADLGHFCLEIYGRNGAWVDDRYYVKGSIVPLAQG